MRVTSGYREHGLLPTGSWNCAKFPAGRVESCLSPSLQGPLCQINEAGITIGPLWARLGEGNVSVTPLVTVWSQVSTSQTKCHWDVVKEPSARDVTLFPQTPKHSKKGSVSCPTVDSPILCESELDSRRSLSTYTHIQSRQWKQADKTIA